MIEQRNLILAVVLSVVILVAFQFFYQAPRIEQAQRQQATEQAQPPAPAPAPGAEPGLAPQVGAPAVPGAPSAPGAPAVSGAPAVPGQAQPAASVAEASRTQATAAGRRLSITSKRLNGSLLLDGGRIDDLTLADYHLTPDPRSPEIVLLSPAAAPHPYYVEFGWVAGPGGAVKLPGAATPWHTDDRALSPGNPVRLVWDNGEGLIFRRTLSLDENYMITVSQRVDNQGDEAVTLFPYGLISRTDTPKVTGFYILHEGALGVFNGTLDELDYDDIVEGRRIERASTGGWAGITDKYWLIALIPDQVQPFTASYNHSLVEERDKYQVDYLREATVVPAGGSAEISDRLFAGAKRVKLLSEYDRLLTARPECSAFLPGDRQGCLRFDLAIDWGWFQFLTKPIFHALDFFNHLIGNFGLAILLLTILIKLLFFPLANKSYKAMSKMKMLQPEITKMRERFGDDRQRLNKEMMELYKKQKVNPMAGCLPMVIQIPVFFALYKVLFVTIEMRHAPFFGWITDLSAPDPTTVTNLFGLIPWTPPDLSFGFLTLHLGVWPLLMGISMFLQQKLNPQPADPIQARLFMLMPIFFTFLLASFPAGLVIYWTWNNVLSIAQQWVIMRRAGVR